MKERAKLQRGKRCQGSSEEEDKDEKEEEEGDEDLPSPQEGPFLWHLLEQEGEDSPPEMAGASYPALPGPSTAPPEPRGAGGSALSEPPKQRKGLKRQRDEES